MYAFMWILVYLYIHADIDCVYVNWLLGLASIGSPSLGQRSK